MAYLKEHEDHVAAKGAWSGRVFYMTNANGSIHVLACTECDHVEVECQHMKCSWNDDETLLTCNLCLADAT